MMKKYILLLFLLPISCAAYAQTFDELLVEGKNLVKVERAKDYYHKSDYSDAIAVLQKAVKLNPKSTEAHYFLGSAYDYDNSNDSRYLTGVNKDKTARTSREFEAIIQLSPYYDGEQLAQDPYGKITSIWGSLGYTYCTRNMHDSAVWAFKEGKKRGGFTDFGLAFYRNYLYNCKQNAIAFTYGDFSTIIFWYLQEVEQLRPDITVINLSMIDVPWYSAFISSRDHSIFSSESIATDTTLYYPLEKYSVKIPVRNTKQSITWKFDNQAVNISRQTKLFIDAMTHNRFQRQVYFEKGTDEALYFGLDTFIHDNLFTVTLDSTVTRPSENNFVAEVEHFPFEVLKLVNTNCDADLFIVNGLRMEMMRHIDHQLRAKKRKEAQKLYQKLLKEIPESKYRLTNPPLREYLDFLAQELTPGK